MTWKESTRIDYYEKELGIVVERSQQDSLGTKIHCFSPLAIDILDYHRPPLLLELSSQLVTHARCPAGKDLYTNMLKRKYCTAWAAKG
ncbi:hypothetical protein L1987_32824 [Smallanthus sonchifolius]|uniref:Uncharacterized protein n=1 Tax=Smallanthus sonchifolius TaxID=185202 RepID=A0ACB9HQJ9_9ASTR|nr:hypothetical protein L1987_32824 [Smallanthus sonchifolius]